MDEPAFDRERRHAGQQIATILSIADDGVFDTDLTQPETKPGAESIQFQPRADSR